MSYPQESFTFTVGKLDAGMAILLGERAHLIEFPSILLPAGATTGSIVNIAVHQNHGEEKKREDAFWNLQEDILEAFGREIPETPQLKLRNTTQTSITLEWPPLQLATATLRSLDIYRNGQRLTAIPSPLTNTSTKLSGLEMNTEYTFQLILRTTAGTYPSNVIKVRTHRIEDTSGIRVCFGTIEDPVLRSNAEMALDEMGAKWSDKIQIDTTHFVCTTPAQTPSAAAAVGGRASPGSASSSALANAPGVEYQRALQLSIPVVTPLWVLACHSEKKMVAIAQYYLGAEPPTNASATHFRPQSMSASSPSQSHSPQSTTPTSAKRQSMPAPTTSPFIGQAPQSPPATIPETPAAEDAAENEARTIPTQKANENAAAEGEEEERREREGLPSEIAVKRQSRSGTMDRNFRFPPSNPGSPSIPPTTSPDLSIQNKVAGGEIQRVITPSSIEVPPPPPVEKERSTGEEEEDGEEDLGPTEEIEL